jgi:hypothetical protein
MVAIEFYYVLFVLDTHFWLVGLQIVKARNKLTALTQ